jgi:hypothetical protein
VIFCRQLTKILECFEIVPLLVSNFLQVRDIPCGTKGGVMISFEKIEVVNRLNKEYVYDTILEFGVSYDKTWIYDKIHHEINQFCSSHSLQEVYIDKFDQVVSPLPFFRLSLPGKTIIM